MLLRATHGGAVGVDPIALSDETKAKYAAANIEFIHGKAEEFTLDQAASDIERFDEGWMYNCLQHVDDPNKVMTALLRDSDAVRIFEWIEVPTDAWHLHRLTAAQFEQWLPQSEWNYSIWNIGELLYGDDGAYGRYIAIYARRRAREEASAS